MSPPSIKLRVTSCRKNEYFDWVISLCDDADTQCPSFIGGATRTHIPVADPPRATGSEEEILDVYRQVRDQIRKQLGEFFRQQ